MNRARVLELAEFLERDTEHSFHMSSHETCIMGFAHRLFDLPGGHLGFSSSSEVARALDISEDDANDLFLYPMNKAGVVLKYSLVTREVAAATLRRFSDTGETHFVI